MKQFGIREITLLAVSTIDDCDRISKLKQTGEPLLFPAYKGVQLTQLVELYGLDMMHLISEIDPDAARLTAADMAGAIGVKETNQNPIEIAAAYLTKQLQAQYAMIDGTEAVAHEHKVGREALLRTVAIFDGAEYQRGELDSIHRAATKFLRSFDISLNQIEQVDLNQPSFNGPNS